MRVKDPSRANPEKPKRSKRPNRQQDEDSSDDISGKYIRPWGWGLVTSMLTNENDSSAVPWNTFLVWIYSRNIPSQEFVTWLVVTLRDCLEGLESWLIFDDNFFKAGENGPFSCVEDEACVAGVCSAEWRASIWAQREKRRAQRVEAGLGCPCRAAECAGMGLGKPASELNLMRCEE